MSDLRKAAVKALHEHEAWAYDMIDRFLRNNLYDDDYAEFVGALDSLCSPPPPRKEWVGLTAEDIFEITERHTKEGGVCDGWIVAVEVQQKFKEKNT